MKPPQIGNVVFGKMQVFHILNDLLQPSADCIPAIAGVCPVKCVKHHRIMVPSLEVACIIVSS